MSIEAKQTFVWKIENELKALLTVTELASVIRAVNNTLEGYYVAEAEKKLYKPEDDDLLGAYLASMAVQGRSEKTVRQYKYVIGRFMRTVGTTTRSITVYHIRNWLAAEKKRGIQDTTLETNRQTFSAYFGWLHREGLIEKNPMVNIGVIKCQKKKKQVFTDIDMEKMDQACTTLRDRAIIHLLRSTGCRVSEMTGMNRNSINLSKKECTVHGKGNKDRTVYMDSITQFLLQRYLDERTDSDDALFIGRRGERLRAGGVRIMMNTLEKASKVEHIHPHKFRRTLATELARRGMNILVIASILGHERIETTRRYIVLNNDDIKNDYLKYA